MKNKAFSLIELSIVILIIGILVAGVTSSSRLIKGIISLPTTSIMLNLSIRRTDWESIFIHGVVFLDERFPWGSSTKIGKLVILSFPSSNFFNCFLFGRRLFFYNNCDANRFCIWAHTSYSCTGHGAVVYGLRWNSANWQSNFWSAGWPLWFSVAARSRFALGCSFVVVVRYWASRT